MGRSLAAMSETARTTLRRDHVGLVFQFFYLMPHLSVHDNVALPSLIAGDRPRQFEPRVAQLLDRVGLSDRAHERVQKLSGGRDAARGHLPRPAARRPHLLLADEPTGNLDDENGWRVMELMLSLVAEEGGTLIFVTHSREVSALAGRGLASAQRHPEPARRDRGAPPPLTPRDASLFHHRHGGPPASRRQFVPAHHSRCGPRCGRGAVDPDHQPQRHRRLRGQRQGGQRRGRPQRARLHAELPRRPLPTRPVHARRAGGLAAVACCRGPVRPR